METISITVTGRIGSAARTGTTKNGKAWTSFSLAADLPPRPAGGESQTRWYTIWAYGPLAAHVAGSLAKGDMVTVRADDITCRAWTDDRDPGQKPRAQAELRAYDVAASMRFEYLVERLALAGCRGLDYWLRREIPSDSAMWSASMARSPSPRCSRACRSSLRELLEGLCGAARSGSAPCSSMR